MTTGFNAAALAAALAATMAGPATAREGGHAMDMSGMMGGNCQMMHMMGQSMMGHGMMGGDMMQGGMSGDGNMRQGMGQQSESGAPAAHGHGDRMGGGMPMMAAMVEGRLAFLKAALAVTDAQMAVWTGYADAVKARVKVMHEMRGEMHGKMQSGTAIERMDARMKGMQAMIDAMAAVQPATVALYEALSDDQKKVADRLIGAGCGAM